MLEVAVPNWILESAAVDLADFFSLESLAEDYSQILNGHYDVVEKKYRIAIGADRIDLSLFERDKDKHLRAVQRKVLQGRYTFSPFLEHQIAKVDSKELRTISIASIRDTIVQRALYRYFYDTIESKLIEPVFGYRKGKSAHDAVRTIQRHFSNGRTSVFDADLTKFFDRVDHDELLNKIELLPGIDATALKLVFRFLKTGSVPSDQVAEIKNTKGKQKKYKPNPRNQGVPQGGVLSGMLSNLYLAEFDQKLFQQYPGYVRYADDFLICCDSESECLQAKNLVNEKLPLGAELNLSKTTDCVQAERGVDFLGFRVRLSRLSVRGRNIGKFKKRITDLIAHHSKKDYKSLEKAFEYLIPHLVTKIEGPAEEQLQDYANLGFKVARYRRSWIGFFRIANDGVQMKGLDRWIVNQVKAFAWKKFQEKVSLAEIRERGLPSLVNTKYKARKSKTISAQKNLS